jgi:hypothetical protein
MSKCFIQSIGIENRLDYWKDIRIDEKIKYIEINTKDRKDTGSYIGQGFIIDDYVITCKHIIGSIDNTICYYFEFDKLIKKKLIFIGEIKNYDICVLKFEDTKICYSDFLKTFEQFLKNNKLSKCIDFGANIDVSYYEINKDMYILKHMELKTEYMDMKHINLKSMFIPKIPIYILSKVEGIDHGSSGTLACQNEIPIGMIDFKSNESIGIIPIEIIFELLKTKLNIKHSTIKFKYDIIEIEDNSYKYGLILKENITLVKLKKKVILNENNVILEIDNCDITEKGIFNKQLNMYVDLDFHLLLQNDNINIIYNKNEFETDKNISVNVNKIIIDNIMMSIPINHIHKYYYYKGMIFTELSEELIFYYSKKYSMSGRYIENYWNITPTNKIVIMVDKIKSELKKEYLYYDELIKLLEDNHLIILRKIGRYNITSLNNLNNIINNKDITHTFTIEKHTSLYDIIL